MLVKIGNDNTNVHIIIHQTFWQRVFRRFSIQVLHYHNGRLLALYENDSVSMKDINPAMEIIYNEC